MHSNNSLRLISDLWFIRCVQDTNGSMLETPDGTLCHPKLLLMVLKSAAGQYECTSWSSSYQQTADRDACMQVRGETAVAGEAW
jgi:hypothetical protein